MRKLVALALLGVVLAVVDQGARLFAEGELVAQARQAATDESAASAEIDSFPFLARLATSGAVARVRVRVDGPRAGPLRLASVVVDASGVRLDRGRLVSGQVRLEDIERGSVAVEVDGGALADVLKVPVAVADGLVRIGVRGATVTAGVEVDDGVLVLLVSGLPALRVPIVRTALVPCAVTSLSVVGDRLRLACEVDELPPALRR